MVIDCSEADHQLSTDVCEVGMPVEGSEADRHPKAGQLDTAVSHGIRHTVSQMQA